MKNSVEIFNSRLDQTEKGTCELEARSFEILQSEQEKEKEKKKRMKKREKKNLCELWDTFKGNNLLLFVVLEEEVRWNGF